MKKALSFFVMILLLSHNAEAVETGKPFATTYTAKEIGGHLQNWAFLQDRRGVIYLGSGFGVHEFDGSTWRLILAPNESFGRSLTMDDSGRIYVGCSSMFGYLAPDAAGSLRFVSLYDYIAPEDRVFSYVWCTLATPDGIYFLTRERLFRFRQTGPLSGETASDSPASGAAAGASASAAPGKAWEVKVWRSPALFGYMFWRDQGLYVQQLGLGMTRMQGDSLSLMPGGEQFANDRVQVFLPLPGKPGQWLIGTFSRGLFVWNGQSVQSFRTDSDALLRSGTIYDGVILPDHSFALGTLNSGLFIIDYAGRTRLHLQRDSGLFSDTINCLFVDADHNLWAGMDGGIAVLEYASPLATFTLPSGSSPTDFRRHQGLIYAAANNGVYYIKPEGFRFELVPGMSGNMQSFFFGSIGGELFVASGGGIYRIADRRAWPTLPPVSLTDVYLSLSTTRVDSTILLGGTTSGLAVMRYHPQAAERLSYLGKIPGVIEYVARILEAEPGTVWLSVSDAGPIRLTISGRDLFHPRIDKFGTSHGLPDGAVTVCKSSLGLAFLTKRGVYRFDAAANRFTPDPFFAAVRIGRNPDEGNVVEDRRGDIWVNLGSETVRYRKQPDNTWRLQRGILARFADDPTLAIFPEADDTIWFATADYVIRLLPDSSAADHPAFPALVRSVAVGSDSLIYNGAPGGQALAAPVLPYRLNGVRFQFAVPSYSNPRVNTFRTRLEGFDKAWSAWKHETAREYTNLPPGRYRFQVQAKNVYEQESTAAVYAFTILAPWYLDWWAWPLYALIAGGLFFGVVRLRTRQLHQRSKALEKIVQERTVEIQAQKDHVEQLSLLGREITDNLSIKGIIDTAYQNVNTLMEASVFGIGLYQHENQALLFPATKEKGETLEEFSVSLNDEDRLAVWCFNHGKDVIINDYGREYGKYIRQLQAPLAGENPESILYLPLQHKDKTIGVITTQSFNKNAYTDYHLNMLRNLATYSAIALDNADAYRRLNELLDDLKSTQEKLVTQSKLAALGALTAGIAHEIKNPLNFVNNFAELMGDLVKELREEFDRHQDKLAAPDREIITELLDTLKENAGKIDQHGKRADRIVRSMLEHSRGKSGERHPTDINAMLEEDINLAYHGMRAQDSTFNIKFEIELDPNAGVLDVVPQDISRVFLNVINNGCYAAHRRKMEEEGTFTPVLSVRSRVAAGRLEIRIRDNGMGIPEAIREKLFTPFFTTKPAGQGTGLGLSISYDIIVHGHGGEMSFESVEGEYAEFIISLPKGKPAAMAG